MLNLLVIDDDESQFFLIERALKLHNTPYNLETCEAREEALEILKAGFDPHLIVSDYFTPAFDIAIDEFIRETKKIKNFKIAIFTGLDFDQIEAMKNSDLERAAKLGAKVYLKKHSHLHDLKKILAIITE